MKNLVDLGTKERRMTVRVRLTAGVGGEGLTARRGGSLRAIRR